MPSGCTNTGEQCEFYQYNPSSLKCQLHSNFTCGPVEVSTSDKLVEKQRCNACRLTTGVGVCNQYFNGLCYDYGGANIKCKLLAGESCPSGYTCPGGIFELNKQSAIPCGSGCRDDLSLVSYQDTSRSYSAFMSYSRFVVSHTPTMGNNRHVVPGPERGNFLQIDDITTQFNGLTYTLPAKTMSGFVAYKLAIYGSQFTAPHALKLYSGGSVVYTFNLRQIGPVIRAISQGSVVSTWPQARNTIKGPFLQAGCSSGSTACWCYLPCPPGTTRQGDGSGCSGPGGYTCDLGYCANSPNPGRPFCPIPQFTQVYVAWKNKRVHTFDFNGIEYSTNVAIPGQGYIDKVELVTGGITSSYAIQIAAIKDFYVRTGVACVQPPFPTNAPTGRTLTPTSATPTITRNPVTTAPTQGCRVALNMTLPLSTPHTITELQNVGWTLEPHRFRWNENFRYNGNSEIVLKDEFFPAVEDYPTMMFKLDTYYTCGMVEYILDAEVTGPYVHKVQFKRSGVPVITVEIYGYNTHQLLLNGVIVATVMDITNVPIAMVWCNNEFKHIMYDGVTYYRSIPLANGIDEYTASTSRGMATGYVNKLRDFYMAVGPDCHLPYTANPTRSPVTTHPTLGPTLVPTSTSPTSQGPTTLSPTTGSPTTEGPTTFGPTTCGPTTASPTFTDGRCVQFVNQTGLNDPSKNVQTLINLGWTVHPRGLLDSAHFRPEGQGEFSITDDDPETVPEAYLAFPANSTCGYITYNLDVIFRTGQDVHVAKLVNARDDVLVTFEVHGFPNNLLRINGRTVGYTGKDIKDVPVYLVWCDNAFLRVVFNGTSMITESFAKIATPVEGLRFSTGTLEGSHYKTIIRDLFVYSGTRCQLPFTFSPTSTPTTVNPTVAPTLSPTSLSPTTYGPTTQGPTSQGPTTQGPTTQGPTTLSPTTRNPTYHQWQCASQLNMTGFFNSSHDHRALLTKGLRFEPRTIMSDATWRPEGYGTFSISDTTETAVPEVRFPFPVNSSCGYMSYRLTQKAHAGPHNHRVYLLRDGEVLWSMELWGYPTPSQIKVDGLSMFSLTTVGSVDDMLDVPVYLVWCQGSFLRIVYNNVAYRHPKAIGAYINEVRFETGSIEEKDYKTEIKDLEIRSGVNCELPFTATPTRVPVTVNPTVGPTLSPTTLNPTTLSPTTDTPTTQGPTTQGPTTQGPTTESPVTLAPSFNDSRCVEYLNYTFLVDSGAGPYKTLSNEGWTVEPPKYRGPKNFKLNGPGAIRMIDDEYDADGLSATWKFPDNATCGYAKYKLTVTTHGGVHNHRVVFRDYMGREIWKYTLWGYTDPMSVRTGNFRDPANTVFLTRDRDQVDVMLIFCSMEVLRIVWNGVPHHLSGQYLPKPISQMTFEVGNFDEIGYDVLVEDLEIVSGLDCDLPHTRSPTYSPTTDSPTLNPTTSPTTQGPTTLNPTTSSPTTGGPTTRNPTTRNPTTQTPTTRAPTFTFGRCVEFLNLTGSNDPSGSYQTILNMGFQMNIGFRSANQIKPIAPGTIAIMDDSDTGSPSAEWVFPDNSTCGYIYYELTVSQHSGHSNHRVRLVGETGVLWTYELWGYPTPAQIKIEGRTVGSTNDMTAVPVYLVWCEGMFKRVVYNGKSYDAPKVLGGYVTKVRFEVGDRRGIDYTNKIRNLRIHSGAYCVLPFTDAPTGSPFSRHPTTGPTLSPTTYGPTTQGPTTLSPTSRSPTSRNPTSLNPTSCSPTTGAPTFTATRCVSFMNLTSMYDNTHSYSTLTNEGWTISPYMYKNSDSFYPSERGSFVLEDNSNEAYPTIRYKFPANSTCGYISFILSGLRNPGTKIMRLRLYGESKVQAEIAVEGYMDYSMRIDGKRFYESKDVIQMPINLVWCQGNFLRAVYGNEAIHYIKPIQPFIDHLEISTGYGNPLAVGYKLEIQNLEINSGTLCDLPYTMAPTTSPTTQGPTSLSPTSRGPTSRSPTTVNPTVNPTLNPTTYGPTSQGPTSRSPTTQGPTTCGPTTQGPTSQGPTTQGPTTQGPTSRGPTTQGPTTCGPTTQGPTSQGPTTQGPTTQGPTTQGPTSQGPTTQGPTTQGPTTCGPTTVSPTTHSPTTSHCHFPFFRWPDEPTDEKLRLHKNETFDGATPLRQEPSIPLFGAVDNFTMCTYFKVGAAVTGAQPVLSTQLYGIESRGQSAVRFWVKDTSGVEYIEGPIIAGAENHVCGVYDGTWNKMTLYINGALFNSSLHTRLATSSALLGPNFYIGSRILGINQYAKFTGTLRDVRLYRCALTREIVGSIVAKPVYMGCFPEDTNDPEFRYGPMQYGYTTETCRAACFNYVFFSLRDYGYCACSNTYGRFADVGPMCGPTCEHEDFLTPTRYCGKPNAGAVYRTGKAMEHRPEFTYAGCYRHMDQSKIVDQWDYGLDWDDCRAIAVRERKFAFGLEFPESYDERGLAHCGAITGSYEVEGKQNDVNCRREKDSNSHNLGGRNYISVYDACMGVDPSIASDLPKWADTAGCELNSLNRTCEVTKCKPGFIASGVGNISCEFVEDNVAAVYRAKSSTGLVCTPAPCPQNAHLIVEDGLFADNFGSCTCDFGYVEHYFTDYVGGPYRLGKTSWDARTNAWNHTCKDVCSFSDKNRAQGIILGANATDCPMTIFSPTCVETDCDAGYFPSGSATITCNVRSNFAFFNYSQNYPPHTCTDMCQVGDPQTASNLPKWVNTTRACDFKVGNLDCVPSCNDGHYESGRLGTISCDHTSGSAVYSYHSGNLTCVDRCATADLFTASNLPANSDPYALPGPCVINSTKTTCVNRGCKAGYKSSGAATISCNRDTGALVYTGNHACTDICGTGDPFQAVGLPALAWPSACQLSEASPDCNVTACAEGYGIVGRGRINCSYANDVPNLTYEDYDNPLSCYDVCETGNNFDAIGLPANANATCTLKSGQGITQCNISTCLYGYRPWGEGIIKCNYSVGYPSAKAVMTFHPPTWPVDPAQRQTLNCTDICAEGDHQWQTQNLPKHVNTTRCSLHAHKMSCFVDQCDNDFSMTGRGTITCDPTSMRPVLSYTNVPSRLYCTGVYHSDWHESVPAAAATSVTIHGNGFVSTTLTDYKLWFTGEGCAGLDLSVQNPTSRLDEFRLVYSGINLTECTGSLNVQLEYTNLGQLPSRRIASVLTANRTYQTQALPPLPGQQINITGFGFVSDTLTDYKAVFSGLQCSGLSASYTPSARPDNYTLVFRDVDLTGCAKIILASLTFKNRVAQVPREVATVISIQRTSLYAALPGDMYQLLTIKGEGFFSNRTSDYLLKIVGLRCSQLPYITYPTQVIDQHTMLVRGVNLTDCDRTVRVSLEFQHPLYAYTHKYEGKGLTFVAAEPSLYVAPWEPSAISDDNLGTRWEPVVQGNGDPYVVRMSSPKRPFDGVRLATDISGNREHTVKDFDVYVVQNGTNNYTQVFSGTFSCCSSNYATCCNQDTEIFQFSEVIEPGYDVELRIHSTWGSPALQPRVKQFDMQIASFHVGPTDVYSMVGIQDTIDWQGTPAIPNQLVVLDGQYYWSDVLTDYVVRLEGAGCTNLSATPIHPYRKVSNKTLHMFPVDLTGCSGTIAANLRYKDLGTNPYQPVLTIVRVNDTTLIPHNAVPMIANQTITIEGAGFVSSVPGDYVIDLAGVGCDAIQKYVGNNDVVIHSLRKLIVHGVNATGCTGDIRVRINFQNKGFTPWFWLNTAVRLDDYGETQSLPAVQNQTVQVYGEGFLSEVLSDYQVRLYGEGCTHLPSAPINPYKWHSRKRLTIRGIDLRGCALDVRVSVNYQEKGWVPYQVMLEAINVWERHNNFALPQLAGQTLFVNGTGFFTTGYQDYRMRFRGHNCSRLPVDEWFAAEFVNEHHYVAKGLDLTGCDEVLEMQLDYQMLGALPWVKVASMVRVDNTTWWQARPALRNQSFIIKGNGYISTNASHYHIKVSGDGCAELPTGEIFPVWQSTDTLQLNGISLIGCTNTVNVQLEYRRRGYLPVKEDADII